MNKNKIGFYSIIVCLMALFIGICSYFLYYFYTIKDSDVDTNALVVNEKANLSYNIDLINEDFKDSYDYNDIVYVPSIVDQVRGNFSYSVSFDKAIKGEYSYSVQGRMIATNDKGEKVINREVYTQPLKKYEVDGNVLNIADYFTFKYQLYHIMYENYVKNYNVDVDAYILYEIDLSYSVYSEDIKRSVTNLETLTFKVPLSEEYTKVIKSDNINEQRKEFSDITRIVQPIYLVICAEFIGAILLCVFIIVYIIRKIILMESEFDKKLKTLLRKYDASIVHIKELPDLHKLNVMFVDNFKDLVDVSNKLSLPIHYVDVVVGHEATFIVINKKRAYVYKLSDKDLRD